MTECVRGCTQRAAQHGHVDSSAHAGGVPGAGTARECCWDQNEAVCVSRRVTLCLCTCSSDSWVCQLKGLDLARSRVRDTVLPGSARVINVSLHL